MRTRLCLIAVFLISPATFAQPSTGKVHELGNLRYRAPEGWIFKAGATKHTWKSDKRGSSGFTWRALAAEDKPKNQFTKLVKYDHRGRRVLRSGPFRRGKGDLKAWTTYRLSARGRGRIYAFHAMVNIYGGAYYFSFASGRVADYRRFMRGPFKEIISSVQAFLPVIPRPAAGDVGTSLELFAFKMPLGKTWKPLKSRHPLPSYMKRYETPSGLRKRGLRQLPIYFQFNLGRPSNPEIALKRWLINHYIPRIPGRSRRTTLRPFFARSWRLAHGERGATYRYWYKSYGYRLTYIAVHILTGKDYTIFMGTSADVTRTRKKQRAAVLNRHGKLSVKLIALAARANFALPERIEKWEDRLKRKKSYFYFYESSTGSPATTWIVRTRKVSWKFNGNGSCVAKSSGYFGVSIQSYNDPYNPSRGTDWTYGSREKKDASGPAHCMVRGRGDSDLWIVARKPGSPGTFHRLEPRARGRFGVFEPRGLSIDGLIEGKYSRTNSARVWKKWK